jgi:uncharacterized DUF497 family protein
MALDLVELEVDDGNEAKMAEHSVSAREMFQLLDDRIEIYRNKKAGTADYVMIGVTHGGRVLTAPIVETAVEGRWRPITAWEASEAEKARYHHDE